ncbi:MAG: hypothetical protein SF187_27950 [Deltaproteobacteria bacterium]|nr:hypothetical protein [Deltaproteobacteria bacterium]
MSLLWQRAMGWAMAMCFVASCAPVAGIGRARTLGKGRYEVGVGPDVTVVTGQLSSGKVPLPSAQLVAGVRYGVSDDADVGGKAWGISLGKYLLESWGVAGEVKWQLRRAPLELGRRGTDVALGLQGTFHNVVLGGTPERMLGASMPLLFGWRVGAANQLVASLRVDYQVWTGESQTPLALGLAGGSVGFVWQWTERWSFMPELAVLWSPLSFNGESGGQDSRGLSILSLGLGIHYRR